MLEKEGEKGQSERLNSMRGAPEIMRTEKFFKKLSKDGLTKGEHIKGEIL